MDIRALDSVPLEARGPSKHCSPLSSGTPPNTTRVRDADRPVGVPALHSARSGPYQALPYVRHALDEVPPCHTVHAAGYIPTAPNCAFWGQPTLGSWGRQGVTASKRWSRYAGSSAHHTP
jgi:hypothetical protein